MAKGKRSLSWMNGSIKRVERELLKKCGGGQRERLTRGLGQVKRFWRAEDGGKEAFEKFVKDNFAQDKAALDVMFERLARLFEKLYGHMGEITIAFQRQMHLDIGPITPLDEITAGYDVSAHLSDDLFANKLAFIVLLNFPMTTLEERQKNGEKWTRREWAEVRLGQFFSKRVPADVKLAISKASAEADKYISEYNIWMHHLVDEKGKRLFPEKLKLLSHWNLRDQLKADYTDAKNGLARQRMIQRVMEQIITQTIPEAVINNPGVDWDPYSNKVEAAAVKDTDYARPGGFKMGNAPEPDTRYASLLGNFNALRMMDPYSPSAPTYIARKFDENREMSEERVKSMLEEVVSSPNAKRVAKLIENRVGRALEPFDIWYDGFKGRGKYSETQLDEIVSKKYTTADDYKNDIPNLLLKLDFPIEKGRYLAENMLVEPARGSGQAVGALMRGEKAHLQTRVVKGGMDYKGFNIAAHEMGHTVEQTLSLNKVDHWFLQGVPNNAFTEAFAFVFQGRDLELLGLKSDDPKGEALKTIDNFWNIYEISGVSLVDMEVWNWLYKNPKAKPAQLKKAAIEIAKKTWNRFYAPVFGQKDVILLAVYSHMISYPLYLPDYAIGYMIKYQIEEQMKKAGSIGKEFERMATFGSVLPDLWMKNATGSPVGPGALLDATEKALDELEDNGK